MGRVLIWAVAILVIASVANIDGLSLKPEQENPFNIFQFFTNAATKVHNGINSLFDPIRKFFGHFKRTNEAFAESLKNIARILLTYPDERLILLTKDLHKAIDNYYFNAIENGRHLHRVLVNIFKDISRVPPRAIRDVANRIIRNGPRNPWLNLNLKCERDNLFDITLQLLSKFGENRRSINQSVTNILDSCIFNQYSELNAKLKERLLRKFNRILRRVEVFLSKNRYIDDNNRNNENNDDDNESGIVNRNNANSNKNNEPVIENESNGNDNGNKINGGDNVRNNDNDNANQNSNEGDDNENDNDNNGTGTDNDNNGNYNEHDNNGNDNLNDNNGIVNENINENIDENYNGNDNNGNYNENNNNNLNVVSLTRDGVRQGSFSITRNENNGLRQEYVVLDDGDGLIRLNNVGDDDDERNRGEVNEGQDNEGQNNEG